MRTWLLITLLAVAAACGDDSGEPGPPVGDRSRGTVRLRFSRIPEGFGIASETPPVQGMSGLGLSPRGELLLTSFDFASRGGWARREELRKDGLWIEGAASYALRFPWITGVQELSAGPPAAGAGANDLRIEGSAGAGAPPVTARMREGARFTVEVKRANVSNIARHPEHQYVSMDVDLHLVARHLLTVRRGTPAPEGGGEALDAPREEVEAVLEFSYRGPLQVPDGDYPWLPQ